MFSGVSCFTLFSKTIVSVKLYEELTNDSTFDDDRTRKCG